jgi:hypothetical protein
MGAFTQQMHIPAPFAFLAIAAVGRARAGKLAGSEKDEAQTVYAKQPAP